MDWLVSLEHGPVSAPVVVVGQQRTPRAPPAWSPGLGPSDQHNEWEGSAPTLWSVSAVRSRLRGDWPCQRVDG